MNQQSTPADRSLVSDRFAESLRQFGLLGILAILVIFAGNLVILPLSAMLVLVWASGHS